MPSTNPVREPRLETLSEATRRYRLREPSMTNIEIARHSELENESGDFKGIPGCCFFKDGYLCAIRTQKDEIAVFHLFQSVGGKLSQIADRILPGDSPEDSHD